MEKRRILYGVPCGIAAFAAALVMLIFVGSLLQYRYGMAGLAMTELMILAIALLCTIGFSFDLKDTFPIAKPKGRQIGGTVVIWAGFWLLVMSLTMCLIAIFPDGFGDMESSMTDFIMGVSFPLRLFIMAVMPAVCEEALFRGFIQRAMGNMPQWPRVLLVSLLFGILHLDPIRIPITAALGVGLGIVMLKTKNILLPILYHFLHNGISVLSTLASGMFLASGVPDAVMEAQALLENPKMMLVSSCFFGIGAPFLILAGNILLEPVRPYEQGRFRNKRRQFTVAGIATGIYALGFVISILMVMRG